MGRIAVAAWACCCLLLATAGVQAAETITLGRPTKNIQRDYARLLPIAGYLAGKLGRFGIVRGEVLVEGMNRVEGCIDLIKSGKIDLIFETPYSALRIIKETDAKPLLSVVREGANEYGSYIFVLRDSGITSLKELRGKVMAFEDPGSTSGFFLPYKAMKDEGLDLVALNAPDAPVPAEKTGYVYSQGELNTSSWVFYGVTNAGAQASTDWTRQEVNPEAFREQFRIIYETKMVPRMLVLARPGLDPALEKAAQDVLLAMSGDEQGRAALAPYGFDGFTEIGDPGEFTRRLENTLLVR